MKAKMILAPAKPKTERKILWQALKVLDSIQNLHAFFVLNPDGSPLLNTNGRQACLLLTSAEVNHMLSLGNIQLADTFATNREKIA